MLRAADLLVYPVRTSDRQAMADLVLDTLTAYFDPGCVAAEAARRLPSACAP